MAPGPQQLAELEEVARLHVEHLLKGAAPLVARPVADRAHNLHLFVVEVAGHIEPRSRNEVGHPLRNKAAEGYARRLRHRRLHRSALVEGRQQRTNHAPPPLLHQILQHRVDLRIGHRRIFLARKQRHRRMHLLKGHNLLFGDPLAQQLLPRGQQRQLTAARPASLMVLRQRLVQPDGDAVPHRLLHNVVHVFVAHRVAPAVALRGAARRGHHQLVVLAERDRTGRFDGLGRERRDLRQHRGATEELHPNRLRRPVAEVVAELVVGPLERLIEEGEQRGVFDGVVIDLEVTVARPIDRELRGRLDGGGEQVAVRRKRRDKIGVGRHRQCGIVGRERLLVAPRVMQPDGPQPQHLRRG